MFHVMLVILLNIITGWTFLPEIEITISLIIHVLVERKLLGGKQNVTNAT